MNPIEQSKRDLIDAITNGEDYSRFLEVRERLQKNPEKKRKTNELRKHNYELQAKEQGGAFSENMRAFAHEVEISRRDPVIDSYLMAEQRMCRMLQEIFKDIVNQIELDLDFLD